MRDVVTLFRRPRYEEMLMELGGTRLQMYSETRFCYLMKTILTILENLHRLRVIARMENVVIPDNVQAILHSLPFQRWLESTREALNPICRLINICQGPRVSIARASQEWTHVRQAFIEMNRPELNELIDNRLGILIHRRTLHIGSLANMLHPTYQGRQLSAQQRQVAERYLREHFGDGIVEELRHYFNNIGQYERLAAGFEHDPAPF
ncbi:hypothetical protein QAD02_008034 [Eretmocerus hayati]|uniref:Uncharacterized protein n=1 Tax=Eretmocerus hayati TaxID=131215 RepID=A0ACC2N7R4_9HYME|nr:hypothetical protein QAD02_008034 [Eretmocerus hayati]